MSYGSPGVHDMNSLFNSPLLAGIKFVSKCINAMAINVLVHIMFVNINEKILDRYLD